MHRRHEEDFQWITNLGLARNWFAYSTQSFRYKIQTREFSCTTVSKIQIKKVFFSKLIHIVNSPLDDDAGRLSALADTLARIEFEWQGDASKLLIYNSGTESFGKLVNGNFQAIYKKSKMSSNYDIAIFHPDILPGLWPGEFVNTSLVLQGVSLWTSESEGWKATQRYSLGRIHQMDVHPENWPVVHFCFKNFEFLLAQVEHKSLKKFFSKPPSF